MSFEYNELWRCSSCGAINNFEKKYCDECGATDESEESEEKNEKREDSSLTENKNFLFPKKRIIPY